MQENNKRARRKAFLCLLCVWRVRVSKGFFIPPMPSLIRQMNKEMVT